MSKLSFLLLVLAVLICRVQAEYYHPVVLWHGMGDNCCNPESMGKIRELIEESLPGIYVHSIMLGNNESEDRKASFFGNVNDQVATVCETLKADKKLRHGFNAIGFSQGGQFLRAYVQRCNRPKVYSLITFGSQHQGIADIPSCEGGDYWCQLMRAIARRGAYSGYVRDHVVAAQYYKDFTRLDVYRESNIFLPDINNELEVKNKTYKKNLASLNALVLIRFTDEKTVVPPESSWFSFYDENGDIEDLFDTPLYREDWLGLKKLDQEYRLFFYECEGAHMQIPLDFFQEVVIPFLIYDDWIGSSSESPKLLVQS